MPIAEELGFKPTDLDPAKPVNDPPPVAAVASDAPAPKAGLSEDKSRMLRTTLGAEKEKGGVEKVR